MTDDSSSRNPRVVRDAIVLSAGPSSSTRIAIRVHDDIDDGAPTERMAPPPVTQKAPAARRPGSERPTLRSATNRPQHSAGVPDGPPPSRSYYPLKKAAPRLHTNANALRTRCQRAAKVLDGRIIAELGGGVVGFKFGTQWRIRLPDL